MGGPDDCEVEVPSAEFPIKFVTAFEDRAEVSRVAKFSALPVGRCTIKFVGISNQCDRNSVTVRGAGSAEILDVSSEESTNLGSPGAAGSLQGDRELVEAEISAVAVQLRAVTDAIARTRKRVQWLADRSDTLSGKNGSAAGAAGSMAGSSILAMETLSLSSVTEWLDYVERESEKADGFIAAKEREAEALRAKQVLLKKRLAEVANIDPVTTATVLVSLRVLAENSPLELTVTYLVFGASWKPAYDFRATRGSARGSDTLQVTYQASIMNGTMEPWIGVEMNLSTAKPSAGGEPPALPRASVYVRPPEMQHQHLGFKRSSMALEGGLMMRSQKVREEKEEELSDNDEEERVSSRMRPLAPMANSLATISSDAAAHGSGSTVFRCPAVTTIQCDGKPHKATILVADLKPVFTLMATPKSSPYCFIKCSCVNTMQVPLLPGKASVYVNGGFVANTDFAGCGPGEALAVGLGVDEKVKFEYSPEKVTREATQSGGFVGVGSKKTTTVTYEYRTVIKNFNPNKVHVVLYEPLPHSSTDSIKVALLSPTLTPGDTNAAPPPISSVDHVRLNDKNHVEWRFELDKAAAKTCVFSFSVEHRKEDRIIIS